MDEAQSELIYRKRSSTNLLILHESLTRPSEVRPIEVLRWRGRKRGLLDIGHHLIIDRTGGLHAVRPLDVMGAHTPGANHKSISVVILGGVSEEGDSEDNFTPEQRQALICVMAMCLKQWPGITITSRHAIQRRKGDAPRPTMEPGVLIEAAHMMATSAKPLLEVVKLRPPRPQPPKGVRP